MKKCFWNPSARMEGLKIFPSNFSLGKAHYKHLALVMGTTFHHSAYLPKPLAPTLPTTCSSLPSHALPISSLPELNAQRVFRFVLIKSYLTFKCQPSMLQDSVPPRNFAQFRLVYAHRLCWPPLSHQSHEKEIGTEVIRFLMSTPH